MPAKGSTVFYIPYTLDGEGDYVLDGQIADANYAVIPDWNNPGGVTTFNFDPDDEFYLLASLANYPVGPAVLAPSAPVAPFTLPAIYIEGPPEALTVNAAGLIVMQSLVTELFSAVSAISGLEPYYPNYDAAPDNVDPWQGFYFAHVINDYYSDPIDAFAIGIPFGDDTLPPVTRTTGLKYSACNDLTTAANFGSLFKYIRGGF